MKVKSVISEESRRAAQEYLEEKEISITELAARVGVDRSSMSRYMNENAEELSQITVNKIEEGILKTLQETHEPVADGLLKTRDAQGILFVCQTCRETGEPGIIYGKPGVGKTYTLKFYAKDPRVFYIVCNEAMTTRDLLKKIERVIGLPKGTGSADDRMDVIKEFFHVNKGYLLIVDEADKLIANYSQKKIEVLRDLFDAGVPTVIAGETALISMMAKFVGRYKERNTFGYKPTGLSREEALEYLRSIPMEEDAKEELLQYALDEKKGSFRKFAKTVKNTERISCGNKITKETVKIARQYML